MPRCAFWCASTLGLAVWLTGCGHSSSSSGIDTTSVLQDGNAAETATTLSMDAAIQALLLNATTASGDPVSTNAMPAAPGPSGASRPGRLDLTRLASGSQVVIFSQLLDVNGARLYPTLNGACTVTASGPVVSSWPTGSTQQALSTVTLMFDQGPVSYVDPANGVSAELTAGVFTFALATTYTYTSAMNWTLTLDGALSIGIGTQLFWSINRPNQPAHSESIYGYRHLNLVETRASTTGINSLQIVRTIDGNGNPGQPAGGRAGVDPSSPGTVFTDVVHVLDLDQADGTQDEWNRIASSTINWNFLVVPAVRTVTPGLEEIFFTRNGVQSGPYTSASLRSALVTSSND